MEEIGIRELRQHASRYLQAVSQGATITVTDRGRPVARLTPLSPLEQRITEQLAVHRLIPPSRRRRRYADDTRLTGAPVGPILSDDRAERLA
jgi:prevent-host-death family protein